VKFTERGHVIVRIESPEYGSTRALLRISVEDSGVGIPREMQQHMFQKFTQGDPSVTRRFGGTGLGLAISKQLVKLMGGDIGLTSEAGMGSTFWFTLPLKVAESKLELDLGLNPPVGVAPALNVGGHAE
jgi:signal transduction histidine kinase